MARRMGAGVGLLVLWTWLALYFPWLLVFPRNLWRYWHLPVDAASVAEIAEKLPGQAPLLEAWVRQAIPWKCDFELYGVPWYVPTPREALAAGAGDCEAQAVILASLLEYHGIPYRLRASLSHLWVEYEGRPQNREENEAISYWSWEKGQYRFQWPTFLDLQRQAQLQKSILWDPMPRPRKGALLGGWAALAAILIWRRRTAPTEGRGR